MVTLEQVLENFESHDDSEMKRITDIITGLLVSYSGAIYIPVMVKATYMYMYLYVQDDL